MTTDEISKDDYMSIAAGACGATLDEFKERAICLPGIGSDGRVYWHTMPRVDACIEHHVMQQWGRAVGVARAEPPMCSPSLLRRLITRITG